MKNGPWIEEETKFLIENYGEMTYREIAQKLDRTKESVYYKVQKLRIKHVLPQTKRYSDQEEYDPYLDNMGISKIIVEELRKVREVKKQP